MINQKKITILTKKKKRIKTPMLRSDLCDFNDAYIVVKADITVTNPSNTKRNKAVAFKNNAPFINCISKINGIQIDNAEDLDVVMPIYNSLEYSKNYKKTTESLWNYYRDQPSNRLSTNSESFKYKTSITKNTYSVDEKITDDDGNEVDNPNYDANKVGKNKTEIVIPLKHLIHFWRSLNILLINCEVELILTWTKNCALADMTVANNPPTGLEFQIPGTKLYVPVFTLSKENDIKLLEKLKSGFKKTIKWNRYRSQMTIQNNNNNLNYLFDPTFTNVNRLFVLSFERIEEDVIKKDCRDSFSHYYVPNVQVKDFNVLIDGKSFFDLPIKNEEEAYQKIIDMSNNNNYTTDNLLDFAYYKENYKLTAIDLSKQTKIKDPQQINFIGKIEGQNNGVAMFFIIEKSEETTFEFLQNSVNILSITETQKIVNLLNNTDNEYSKFATKNGTS